MQMQTQVQMQMQIHNRIDVTKFVLRFDKCLYSFVCLFILRAIVLKEENEPNIEYLYLIQIKKKNVSVYFVHSNSFSLGLG